MTRKGNVSVIPAKKTVRLLAVSALGFVTMAALLLGCGGGDDDTPAGDALTRAFFPLQIGDTRRYIVTRPAGTADTLVQTVDSQTEAATGTPLFTLITRDGAGSVRRVDVNGHADNAMLWAGSDEGTTASFRLNPPLATQTGLIPGRSVQFTTPTTGAGALATVGNVTSTVTFVGLESVTVPAGTFPACARLRLETVFRNAAGSVILSRSGTTYLAPGIGPIKVDIDGGNAYELTSAKVGDRTIP